MFKIMFSRQRQCTGCLCSDAGSRRRRRSSCLLSLDGDVLAYLFLKKKVGIKNDTEKKRLAKSIPCLFFVFFWPFRLFFLPPPPPRGMKGPPPCQAAPEGCVDCYVLITYLSIFRNKIMFVSFTGRGGGILASFVNPVGTGEEQNFR